MPPPPPPRRGGVGALCRGCGSSGVIRMGMAEGVCGCSGPYGPALQDRCAGRNCEKAGPCGVGARPGLRGPGFAGAECLPRIPGAGDKPVAASGRNTSFSLVRCCVRRPAGDDTGGFVATGRARRPYADPHSARTNALPRAEPSENISWSGLGSTCAGLGLRVPSAYLGSRVQTLDLSLPPAATLYFPTLGVGARLGLCGAELAGAECPPLIPDSSAEPGAASGRNTSSRLVRRC